MVRLQIVGGGKMGEALLGGLLKNGWAEVGDMAVVEKVEARRHELESSFPGLLVAEDPVACEGAVIAVKPGDVPGACGHLATAGVGRVLSIAAGVTLATLEAALPPATPVIRAMPNTPALVGAGASAIAGGTSTADADLDWAESILGAVGIVVRTEEVHLDAVTGLSGSGPAYVFLVAESLIEAGIHAGLSREMSRTLVGQTMMGAGRLLVESGRTAAELREAVTSPNGTTEAGLRVLADAEIHLAFDAAVEAATLRSRELGQA